MASTSAARNSLDTTLVGYGADLNALHRFEHDGPDLLPYATLVKARESGGDLDALLSVYEWQDSPLIFLLDGDRLQNDELQAIRRRLAMRGDTPYLGVVRPGQLIVHQISLDAKPSNRSEVPLDVPTRQTFAHLGNNRPGVNANRGRWISEVVLTLLDQSISKLMNCPGVTGEDAISLVGRALFTRFLADRDLLPGSLIPNGPAGESFLFDDPERAEATSQWLDDTFNGEFLPLSLGLYHKLPEAAFGTLGDVLRRTPSSQYYLEWTEDWAHLDFAHIPVGVLSQAYELFLRKHQPQKQRKEGGYYTPNSIAQVMVRAAFHALRRDGGAHRARVLDPAAGAGVFLLNAFRQLVAERWQHDGKRPDTQTLREILYGQITGFDINEPALRFAALGLYLLSIELDPNPEPVEKLRFKDLRTCSVLKKVGEAGSLGSLGDGVGDEHLGCYDLVIGNPPWASSTQIPKWSLIANRVQRIARARVSGGSTLRLLPNQVLDLPFIWRAMEWAKLDGQIAFALHARILFQQHEGMPEARNALFAALDVTGILNGAELRHSNVWPKVSAPFCLLFARNRPSPPGARFRFVSPHLEDQLHRVGGLRIDAANAEVVTPEQIARTPTILKTLFRGGPLDVEVFERLVRRKIGTIRQYWQMAFGGSGQKLTFAGNGYQKLRRSSRIRKNGDGKPGVSAAYLSDFCELTAESLRSPLVDRDQLIAFGQERIHDRRPKSLFKGPLLLVHKSPPAGDGRIRVAVTDDDLVFNETYYGYSAHSHPNGRQLVRYLALLIGSRPAFWHCLVTSGEFGFEREVVEKGTIDGIPIPSFDTLDASSLTTIETLFDALVTRDDEETWAAVDTWVADLYGLRESDLEVIEDTLRYNLPFAENRSASQARPTSQEIDLFRATLAAELEPWAARSESTLAIGHHSLSPFSPWRLVRVHLGRSSEVIATPIAEWPEVLLLADQLAATEVLLRDGPEGSIWIARLAQARYWSPSQARLVARRIVWEHVDVLLGTGRE